SWMSFKRIAVNASLVLASVPAALIVCEIVLRILSLAPAPRVESWGPRTLVVRDAEFRFLEQTNSIGLRDVREFSKTSRSRRIAFLADSITYGEGVSNAETFSARTQALPTERSDDTET